MNKEMTKIVLVDDHHLVRAGLRNLINQLDGYRVVADAANIVSALEAIQGNAPDIVVTDIDMGEDSGLTLIEIVKKNWNHLPVIVLSMHATEAFVEAALRNGASGYLLKDAAPEELGLALKAVRQGETFLSPAVSTKMINRFVAQPSQLNDPLSVLTERQKEILIMLANGMANKEIAYKLNLSDKTVAAHRAQITERLGVRDLVGIIKFAIKHGLMQSDAA